MAPQRYPHLSSQKSRTLCGKRELTVIARFKTRRQTSITAMENKHKGQERA